MSVTSKHRYMLNIQTLGLVVSEKKIFYGLFSHYKPMVDNYTP